MSLLAPFDGSALGRIRTYDLRIRSPLLYPLSHEGSRQFTMSCLGLSGVGSHCPHLFAHLFAKQVSLLYRRSGWARIAHENSHQVS